MHSKYIAPLLGLLFISFIGIVSFIGSNKNFLTKKQIIKSKAAEIGSVCPGGSDCINNIVINNFDTGKSVNKFVLGQNLYYSYFEDLQGLGTNARNEEWAKQMLRKTGASIIRYPGGSFSDNFPWYHSIGPVNMRTTVCRDYDVNTYTFGIAEFLNVAKDVGAEVVYTANEDRAEPLEIKDLVEFTNGELTQEIKNRAQQENWTVDDWRHGRQDTSGYQSGSMPQGYYAWLRAQPGYGGTEQPWKIKYWEIGNEIFAPYCPGTVDQSAFPQCPALQGCPYPANIGRKYNTLSSIQTYKDRLLGFATAIKSIDARVQVGAVGINNCNHSDCNWWHDSIINDTRLTDKIDFLIDHPYRPGETQGSLSDTEYTQALLSFPQLDKNYLNAWKNKLLGGTKPRKIAYTEHGYEYNGFETDFNKSVRAALMTAGRLQNFFQNDVILMANYWHFRMIEMVDFTKEQELGPTGKLYELYAKYLGTRMSDVIVQNATTHSVRQAGQRWLLAQYNVPDLDTMASYSPENKKLAVFIINRNISRHVQTHISLPDITYGAISKVVYKSAQGTIADLKGDAVANPALLSLTINPLQTEELGSLALPPASLTIIEVQNIQPPVSGTHITVNAKGTICQGGYPTIALKVGSTELKRWTVSDTLTDYVFDSPDKYTGLVSVNFLDDCYAPPEDRNLYINHIIYNDMNIPSDAQGAINVGGTGKWLWTNGYIQYPSSAPEITLTPTPPPGMTVSPTQPIAASPTATSTPTVTPLPTRTPTPTPTTPVTGTHITVRAYGTLCQGVYPTMILKIGTNEVKTWNNVGPSMSNYTFDSPQSYAGAITVHFTNDCYKPPEDRNLFVDYITINGTTIQSETQGVYNTGGYTEWLWRNGFIQYPAPTSGSVQTATLTPIRIPPTMTNPPDMRGDSSECERRYGSGASCETAIDCIRSDGQVKDTFCDTGKFCCLYRR
jgi:alpha-L-arabinofuranosidase